MGEEDGEAEVWLVAVGMGGRGIAKGQLARSGDWSTTSEEGRSLWTSKFQEFGEWRLSEE